MDARMMLHTWPHCQVNSNISASTQSSIINLFSFLVFCFRLILMSGVRARV